MKQFIVNILLFFLFLFLIVFISGRNYHFNDDQSDYLDAIIDKHRLAEKTPSPRIILGGGSNLAFGIDSKKIENAIGLPVINLGLHAGLGLDFIVNEIKYIAKPTDIVILSIEYDLTIKGSDPLKEQVAKKFSTAKNFYRSDYQSNFKSYFEEELVGNIKNNAYQLCAPKPRIEKTIDTRSVYARGAFNEYGDVIRHLKQPPPDHLDDRVTLSYSKWEGINYLNAFAEYARANNIRLYFMYPNYPETQYVVNKEVILKFASDMRRELKIQIINNPEDFVFSDSMFFNTIYHLNKTGRDQRTSMLVEILKNREISGMKKAKDDNKK